MRLRSSLIVGVVAAILLAGCSATPTPKPSPSSTPSAVAEVTPTPTPEPIIAPEAAFDVTCADVAEVVEGIAGQFEGEVEPAFTLISSSNWYPGPAQYMMQRAAGIACSAGIEGRYWNVWIAPQAQVLVDGVVAHDGYAEFQFGRASCHDGGCIVDVRDQDILLSATIVAPELVEADGARAEQALAALASSAASTLHDVPYIDSEITGIDCSRFLTAAELAEDLGAPVELLDQSNVGGWGVESEVYNALNDAPLCSYVSSQDFYNGTTYLVLTGLPAGAWAFEGVKGTPVVVEGADAAFASTDVFGRAALDVRIGADWIRLTTDESGESVVDPIATAEKIVKHLEAGRPAPQ